MADNKQTLLNEIQVQSIKKRNEVSKEIKKGMSKLSETECTKHICIYACGSMGRKEMTDSSDLDLFFITQDISKNGKKQEREISNIDKYRFFGALDETSRGLRYADPSKGGLYWDFISETNLLDIGSRKEDYNNSFTARMLLLLESVPLFNKRLYEQFVKKVVGEYFRDYADNKDDFVPLFLMNDIKRYWYTLTANYEARRDPKDDNNKKYWKRLKLKYARLLTCYSMIACLYEKEITPDYIIDCVHKTPIERLEMLSSKHTELTELPPTLENIKGEYEWYLGLRKEGPEWWNDTNHKNEAFRDHSPKFHNLVLREFLGKLSETNPRLRELTDEY